MNLGKWKGTKMQSTQNASLYLVDKRWFCELLNASIKKKVHEREKDKRGLRGQTIDLTWAADVILTSAMLILILLVRCSAPAPHFPSCSSGETELLLVVRGCVRARPCVRTSA